jgi:hypothetical protein
MEDPAPFEVASFVDGVDEVEFDAVMGCDPVARGAAALKFVDSLKSTSATEI